MPRRPLTPLQVELIERHRQRDSGRGTITATAEKIEVAPSRRAAARRAKNKPESWTDQIDVDDIWQRWNSPRAVAQQSLQQEAEPNLHQTEPDHRHEAMRLDAEEIYRRWNMRPARRQAED